MKTIRFVVIGGLFAGVALAGASRLHRGIEHGAAAPAPTAAEQTAPPAWSQDMDAALLTAKAQGKDILIEFADPDAPADSSNPRATIFDSDAFRRGAGARFVLVRLVSSADAPPAQATRVATWGQRLGVSQLPTVALLDSAARPYGVFAGTVRDMDDALGRIAELKVVKASRDKSLAAAEHATGADKARALDAALRAVGTLADDSYLEVKRQIVQLDADNAAGLKARYGHGVLEADINNRIQTEVYPQIDHANLPAAIATLDRMIDELHPEPPQRQLLLAFKAQLFFSLGDRSRAERTFANAIDIDPGSSAAAKVRAARDQILGAAS